MHRPLLPRLPGRPDASLPMPNLALRSKIFSEVPTARPTAQDGPQGPKEPHAGPRGTPDGLKRAEEGSKTAPRPPQET
eukprot:3231667-Pyramimonas_sp.AAC.1